MNQYIKIILISVIMSSVGIKFLSANGIPFSDKMKDRSLSESDQQYAKNQYILRVEQNSEEIEIIIREDFKEYGIIRFRKIKKQMYLIEVDNDPGLSAMTEHCRNILYIREVQRNKIYRQIDKKKPLGKVE